MLSVAYKILTRLVAFIEQRLPNVKHAARCAIANGDLRHAIDGPAQIARVLLRQHLLVQK